MKRPANYPALIENILVRLETFIITHCLLGRANIWRSMRKERQQAILKLLIVLAKSCAIAYEGAFVRVCNGVAYPLTVLEMARLSGLSKWSVNRCLADLKELGFIQSGKQVLKSGPDGLECSGVMRKFTKAFWLAIGLYSAFCRAVKYAVAHSKLRISWKFHKIVNKAKNIVSSAFAGNAAAKVLKNDENRKRYRQNQIFLQYLDCSRKHDCGCIGGYASAEVCAFCRKMRARKAGK